MSQIFKKKFPKQNFFDFLEKICETKDNHLIFSKDAFKRGKLSKSISTFYETLKPYYYPSKQHYLERDIIYKNLVTVVRQLCKFHCIPFTSTIKYSKSKYEIKYFIYHDLEEETPMPEH